MELVIKETPTKKAEKLLQFAKQSQSFVTGAPEKVLSYILKEGKVIFVCFKTSGGIEDCYDGKNYNCLADCMDDGDKEVRFK